MTRKTRRFNISASSFSDFTFQNSHVIAEVSTSIVDILSKVGLDFAASRRLNREFDEIADKVADNLAPFFAAEGAQLDDGEKTAVAIALGDAISRIEIGPATLTSQFDLRTERLAAAILQEARPDTRDFSRDAHALLSKSALETARYITEAAARLPAFTPTAFGEVLDRQRSVLVLVEEVLAELRRVRNLSVSGISDLQEVPVLSNLTELRSLDLSGAVPLQNIDNVSCLSSLEQLNLRGCVSVQNYTPLLRMSKLRFVILSSKIDVETINEFRDHGIHIFIHPLTMPNPQGLL